ncbi:MAG: large-conductance mechanosensitive channel protein MscL [Candidatus Altiarchaeota archaeon]
MGFIQEFKEFAVRGNVIDMAVGIVIGGAFGKIVSSFVKDVLIPPIGMLMGGVDFANLFIDLSGKGFESVAAATEAGAPVIAYGLFINTIIDFVIIALAIFVVIQQINRLKKKEEEKPSEPPKPTKEEELLTEIRDLLKKK